MKKRAAITAVSNYVPNFILSNALLEQLVDTNSDWIESRTGISERHILTEKNKGAGFMATHAVNDLLKKTNTPPAEIDLLICCTVTPDYLFPATANIISEACGIKNAFSFDLNAACSGFLFGLVTASKFIESGTHKKVIVVGTDKMSSIINYEDRQTCVIFGDAAGAVLLEPNNDGFGILDAELGTDGSGFQHLHQKAGGSVAPPSFKTIEAAEHFVYQQGQQVFKVAVKNITECTEKIMQRNNLTAENLNWFVPHQANKRIIDYVVERLKFNPEKVTINIERYGNTTNATIPLCLFEWQQQMKQGDNVILATFGGGFTWGTVYLKWAFDGK
jgi:3-oxoacyl-[acyl-carrier-protein] synthase III